MMKFFANLLSILTVTTVCLFQPAPVMAESPLNIAKSAGYVGEQQNGYLGIVSANTPESVTKLIKDINMKRRAKYTDISRENGSSINAVEAVVGAKLIARTKPGHFIMSADGKWVKK